MRKLPRQGIFTPTPVIEYDGTLTSTSGKIIVPFTIEQINYRTQVNTRQLQLTESTQQFFFREDEPTTAMGSTKANLTRFTYDRATNIYTGEITVSIGHYDGQPQFTVPQDPNSTAHVGIILHATYWEIPTASLSLNVELRQYPQGTHRNKDVTRTITL